MGAPERVEPLDPRGAGPGHLIVPHRARREPIVERAVVGDDEPLSVLALLEEVVDPLALHPPREEREAALPVLADVLQRAVGAGELERVVLPRQAGALEHRVEDRRQALLDEHPAMAREREPPEPRDEDGAEHGAAGEIVHDLERGQDAVEREGALVGPDGERRAGAEGGGRVERGILDEEVHLEAVERRQRLGAPEGEDPRGGRQGAGRHGEEVGHFGCLQAFERARSRRSRACQETLLRQSPVASWWRQSHLTRSQPLSTGPPARGEGLRLRGHGNFPCRGGADSSREAGGEMAPGAASSSRG